MSIIKYPSYYDGIVTNLKPSIMDKSGKSTKILPRPKYPTGVYPTSRAKITIEFYNDIDGLKMAKKFIRLVNNPNIAIDITFKKLG